MTFFLNLLYSIWCTERLDYVYSRSNAPKKFLSYFILLTPLWLVWLLICGGQYDVGTDYFSYYNIFKSADISWYADTKAEWMFTWIVETFRGLGMPPQGLFYVFYSINFFFLCAILHSLKHRTAFLYVLLYICLSTVFNNQLNGLRQYCAVYIISYAAISFYDNRSYIRYILFVLLAAGFHASAYIMIPFVFILGCKKRIGKWMSIGLITIAVAFSLLGISDLIMDAVFDYLPPYYSAYVDGELDISLEGFKRITKFLFVPFYLLAALFFSKNELSAKDSFLFSIGIIAYSCRLFFLDNFMLNRIGYYFLLLSILPLYVYMKHLYMCYKGRMWCYCMAAVFLLFYFLKTVLFAEGEYDYQSIYF